jgi:mycothiol synthase
MSAPPMTALPDGWTTRRPTLDDVPAILAMVQASDLASLGEVDFTAEAVREGLTDPGTDMTRDCWVALDPGGTIVGWAYPQVETGHARDFIEVYTWPDRGEAAQRPLLDLLLRRVAERAAGHGHETFTVRAGAVPTEKAYVAALTDAGFTFLKQHARMRITLDGVSPVPPAPPAGVTVRPLRPDDEADVRRFHAVIEEAFRDTDHQHLGYDDWRRQVDAETTTTWSEWLVAEVDGRTAGALQSWDGETDEGWVKRLAVAGAYRRRGIGEALLRHAFAVYASNGRTRAGLGVDMENPTRAVRLYLAVGMTPLYRADIFQMTLDLRAGRPGGVPA